MKKDLKPTAFPSVDWADERRRESVDALSRWAVTRAGDAIAWYFATKASHQILCRIFRVASILLAAFSGILPLINEACGLRIHPLWSAIALAAAVTLVLLDRFYGFTSGWIRFMLAGQQLVALLEEFQLASEARKISWPAGAPSQQQAEAQLAAIRNFIGQMHEIIRKETRQWAMEFSEVLKQLDEQLELKQPGAISSR